MISESEALQRIIALVRPGAVEQLPLAAALNRYSAQDILASVPNPPFDNSAMDGYALRAAESAQSAPLRVTGEQPAGLDRHLHVEPGSAVRIFTGAPIPSGADSVIMQEDVDTQQDGDSVSIRCRDPVTAGENIRRVGTDLCRGQRVIAKGERITAGRVGLLASQGMDTIEAYASPRVAVLTTGDELARPGAALLSGQIYDSNGPMLHALLAAEGVMDVTAAHCSDEYADTEATLSRLIAANDFIIVAGGVSVGERDQVKPALRTLGLDPELWRVCIKPGKPFLFCHRHAPRPVHVFGLPGNPVSAFVTFHVFVRAALLHWLGASDEEITPPASLAGMMSDITNPGDRPHYVRGRVDNGIFSALGIQQSHAIHGLSQANALLRLDAGESVAAGSMRPVIMV